MSLWTVPAHQLQAEQARILADILNDLEPDDPRTINDAKNYGSPAGHEKKLRGIPVQGVRGITGTIAGTNPVSALMAKQPNDD